jgi:large subunit ribosomal protein L35
MGYKFKPNKSVVKRFRVTKTGKLKRGGGKRRHLMSRRDAKTRRQQRRPFMLHEGHALNMRAFMGLSGLKPKRVAHKRALAAKDLLKNKAKDAA